MGRFVKGHVCQTKELEYNLDVFEEMVKWDHFMARILQGNFLIFVSIDDNKRSIDRKEAGKEW